MKAIAICHPGTEFTTVNELKERGLSSEVKESVVFFDAEIDQILNFTYTSQSVHKVLLYLYDGPFTSLEDLEKIKLDLPKKETFMVRAKRIGDHTFSAREIESALGKNIDMKVDLSNPDIIVYPYLYEDHIYVGIDLAGYDLASRDYKIFSGKDSLKGNIAFSLAQFYNKNLICVDPFCGDGTIIIEAAMRASNFPIQFHKKNDLAFSKLYDFDFDSLDNKRVEEKLKLFGFDAKLNIIKYAQKNAKLAGVNKQTYISKISIDWLETKFKEGEVDLILSSLPFPNRTTSEKQIINIYDLLFDNVGFVLKKEGKMIVLSRAHHLVLDAAKNHSFKHKELASFEKGDIGYVLFEFTK